MTKKSTSKEVVIKEEAGVTTGEGNDFFSKLAAKAAKGTEILDPQTCTNKLAAEFSEDIAMKYFNLYSTIKPAEVGDVWRPALIGIASKKGNEIALANAKAGGLFFHESKLAIPEGTLFFPIASNIEHTWWDDSGSAICRSMDGVIGERYAGAEKGAQISCGSDSCPNKPEQFQKGMDPCKWTRPVILIDQTMTNLYVMNTRYFSVKKMYEPMVKATKVAGKKFVPQGKSWFSITSFSQGEGQKQGWYAQAVATDQKVSDEEAFVIEQMQGLYKSWRDDLIHKRDNKEIVAATEVETLKVQSTTKEDGSTFSSFSDEPGI